MLCLITKANDDYWYKFEDIKTMEQLMNIYSSVVVEKNHHTIDEIEFWDGFKEEDIPSLEKAKYNVIIYNSYIE